MCEYLQQVKNYTARSVVLLTDDQTGLFGQPTKHNILHALRWLGEYAFQDEKLVIYYSGHGHVPVDRPGTTTKPTTQDETGTMYPVDFRDFVDGIITSAELDELLMPIKRRGAKLTVILDSQVAVDNKQSLFADLS